MEKVTIYEVTCTRSVIMSDQSVGFALEPWGEDTVEIKGFDDGGKEYFLPEGYKVAKIRGGGIGIFWGESHCELFMGCGGKPWLSVQGNLRKLIPV